MEFIEEIQAFLPKHLYLNERGHIFHIDQYLLGDRMSSTLGCMVQIRPSIGILHYAENEQRIVFYNGEDLVHENFWEFIKRHGGDPKILQEQLLLRFGEIPKINVGV